MAKQKDSPTLEGVTSGYLKLSLEDKVDHFRFVQNDLKESANNLKKEVHLREESIDLLSSVIEIKDK